MGEDARAGTRAWGETTDDAPSRHTEFLLARTRDPAMELTQAIDEREVAAMLWTLSEAGATPQPLFDALGSLRMLERPFERGYFRHTFIAQGDGTFLNVMETPGAAPFLADFLDALRCGGLSPASVDAATMPASAYPYPSGSPLCR